MTFIDIQHKISSAEYLDFGGLLHESIKKFKDIWLTGLTMILILFSFGFVLSFLFNSIGISSSPLTEVYDQGFNMFNQSFITSFNILPLTICVSSLTIGLLAGFYRSCKHLDLNQPSKNDLFYYFSSGHTRKILMLGIFHAVITAVTQYLFFIPFVYAFVPLQFFAIVFSNNTHLTEIDIVKISFSLGTKKWFLSFGLLIVTGILGMLGVLACGVGLFFTVSIIYLPAYLIYRNVVGFE